MTTVGQVKSVTKRSIGNVFKVSSQRKRQRKDSTSPKPVKSEAEINRDIQTLKCECTNLTLNNCLATSHSKKINNADWTEVCELIQSCRSDTRFLSEVEMKSFVMKKFKESIKCYPNEGMGERFDMEYVLKIGNVAYIVCKKVFAFCYGFSTNRLEACSKAVKNKSEV
jgi:hypothetical protein